MKGRLGLLILAIIIILLITGGATLLNRSKNQAATTVVTTPKPTEPKSAATSLKNLLSLGKSQMCTYEYTNPESGSVKGVVYLSSGKMRGDFTTTANGKPYSGSMINDTKYVYTWSTAAKQGFKTQITADIQKAMTGGSGSASNQQQSIDTSAKYDYKCSNWSTDASKFTPPGDIKFTDYSSMMKQIVSPTGTTTTDKTAGPQCGACTYLTGDQKTACLAQYKCN